MNNPLFQTQSNALEGFTQKPAEQKMPAQPAKVPSDVITKDKFTELYKTAPAGTSITQAATALMKKGYKIEGLNYNVEEATQEQPQKEGMTSKILKTIGGGVGKVFDMLGVGSISEDVGKFAALPGRAISGVITSGAEEEMQKSLSNLAQVNQALAKKANSLPEGEQKQQLLNLIEQNKKAFEMGGEVSKEIVGAAPTGKEALGTTLKTATDIGAFALPGSTTLKGAAALGGALGAGQAVGETLQKGGTAGQAFESALWGGALGSTLGAAGYGISKLFKKLPEELYQTSIGKYQSLNDIKKEVTGQIEPLKEILTKQGVTLKQNDALSQSLGVINNVEEKIQKVLDSEVGDIKIKTSDIVKSLDELTRRTRNVYGEEGSSAVQSVKDAILEKGDTITLREANQLKRDITKEFSGIYEKADPKLSNTKEAFKKVADSLRTTIADKSKAISRLNKIQSDQIRISQALENKIARQGKSDIIGLTDMVLASGFGGNFPAEIAAVAGKKFFQSQPFQVGLAKSIQSLGEGALSPFAKFISKEMRYGAKELVGDITSQSPD